MPPTKKPSGGPNWSTEHLEQASNKNRHIPFRSDRKLPMHPRKVRGGLKLSTKEGEEPASWITARLNRVIERSATGDALRDGFEYARLGQTRKFDVVEGIIRASIQGRQMKPYTVTMRLKHFAAEERQRIVRAMSEQALYAAKLLAGEVPANIEDLFAPMGLKLFPTEPTDFQITSTAREFADEDTQWSKHAVCVAALLAERLGDDPFLVFDLRGMPRDELMDTLRASRTLAGQGPGPAIVYQSHVPGATDAEVAPLDRCVDRFWEAGPQFDKALAPVTPPQVRFPLLRRLGPSPFTEGRFPMLGLLQTCYELISERAIADAKASLEAETETEAETERNASTESQPEIQTETDADSGATDRNA